MMVRRLLAAVMVIGAGARVVVLVAAETTPSPARGVVIVAGKGRKCSWFEVELRRLSGDGILLLLLLMLGATAGTAAAAGRLLLQMRLLLGCRLLELLLLLLQMLLLLVVVGVRVLLLLRLLLVKPRSDRTPVVVGMVTSGPV